jgi:hypothetical protein
LMPEEVESALFDENTTFDVSNTSGRPPHRLWKYRYRPVCRRRV